MILLAWHIMLIIIVLWLEHSLIFPFFGPTALHQSFFTHMILISFHIILTPSSPADCHSPHGIASMPHAFLFFRFVIAFLTSSFSGGKTSSSKYNVLISWNGQSYCDNLIWCKGQSYCDIYCKRSAIPHSLITCKWATMPKWSDDIIGQSSIFFGNCFTTSETDVLMSR